MKNIFLIFFFTLILTSLFSVENDFFSVSSKNDSELIKFNSKNDFSNNNYDTKNLVETATYTGKNLSVFGSVLMGLGITLGAFTVPSMYMVGVFSGLTIAVAGVILFCIGLPAFIIGMYMFVKRSKELDEGKYRESDINGINKAVRIGRGLWISGMIVFSITLSAAAALMAPFGFMMPFLSIIPLMFFGAAFLFGLPMFIIGVTIHFRNKRILNNISSGHISFSIEENSLRGMIYPTMNFELISIKF